MTDLTVFPSDALSMSSREIADLVDSRHDKVKQSIERLAERRVIDPPPLGDVLNKVGQLVKEYIFSGEKGKRDSIIVVAQLCPEFTARLVDRWQELEAQVQSNRAVIPNFDDPIAAAEAWIVERKSRLLAEQQRQQVELELTAAQPKIEFHDEVATATGQFEVAEAARLILGSKKGSEKVLREWLLENGWVTRRSDGYRATVAIEQRGFMATRMGTQYGHAFSFAVVTPKGLVRLRHVLRADDILAHCVEDDS